MTTFQDPPPQSRRSARQSERGDQQTETQPYTQFSGEQPFVEQSVEAAPAQGAFVEDAPVEAAPAQQDVAPATGRRARPAEPEQFTVAAEPLNYTTQGRDPAAYEAQLPAAGYAPAPQEPAPFRVRDFSPEGSGRRAAAPPLIEPQQSTFAAGAADLEYRTQAGPSAPQAEPVAHHTLSRRELRLRQAELDAAAGAASESIEAPPTPAPVNPIPVAEAPQLRTAPPPTAAALQTAPPPTASAASPAPSYLAAPPPSLAATPTMTTPPPAPVGPPSTLTAPPTAAPTALSNARAEFETLTRTGQPPTADQRVAQTTPTFTEPESSSPWVAPVGHWSRQADLDDETQPWENTITRDVGGGNVATTTSALVLPEIPRPTNFSSALDSTGEVLLTGSIDLPQSLSAGSGDPRRYDDANVDLLYDTQDAEFTGTDSSPVRAISAVSTHTSSRGVIHANKPHGNRLIVVAFVSTAVIALGVVGLLIASLVLNVF